MRIITSGRTEPFVSARDSGHARRAVQSFGWHSRPGIIRAERQGFALRMLMTGIAVTGTLASVAPAEAADSSLAGKVMTVAGPIEPAKLGFTLPDEHLFIDLAPPASEPEVWPALGFDRPESADGQAYFEAPLTMGRIGRATMGAANRDNLRLTDPSAAIHAVTDFKLTGGGTIVDATTQGIGRQPAQLKKVADATGVNIVMATGWFMPAYARDALEGKTARQLADAMIDEITQGVDGASIRAGIIGEISVTDVDRPADEKLIAAAALASAQTGAPISIHASMNYHDPLAILAALKREGADLHRVALGRANFLAHDLPLMKRILQTGAFLEFDNLGRAPQINTLVPDHDVAIAIRELLKAGYGSQILLSQNVHRKIDRKAYGGSGYAFLVEQYIPYLRRLGISGDDIQQMTVANPRQFLTFVEAREVQP